MTDAVAAGTDLLHHVQATDPGSQTMSALLAAADLPALRVTHSLLYDMVLDTVGTPPPGTRVRRQSVLTEIRRRENLPT